MTSGETATGGGGWEILQATARGANKKYSQDSHRIAHTGDRGAWLLAVADGHGSEGYFRSDKGSKWAVDEFIRSVLPFAGRLAERGADTASWHSFKEEAQELQKDICRRWRRRALLHEANHPSHGLPDETGRFAKSVVPYGSTLVAAVVTRPMAFFWQIGDGNAVLIGPDGAPDFPFGEDEDFGDETESLCQPEPWRRMRFAWRRLSAPGTASLVVLSTDGLAKSYAERDGFRRFATDLHGSLGKRGPERVREQLPGWLERAAQFSGDDTTLIAAYAGA